nr:hypothetical protein [Tanacetum cinerariifolium]
MLLEGSELTKEDRESQLYDDFEHFRQHKGESIHDYYVRFAKLINDMRNIKMTMSIMQLNSKFVNNMLPEWGRFMTAQHETHAKENKMMLEHFSQHTVDPLALMSNVSNPQRHSPSSSTLSSTQVPQHLADNPHLDLTGYGGVQYRVGNANSGQARQVKCYKCNGTGHIARNCTQSKRPQNSKYYKDKMLLMQAQENGVALDAEHLLFLAGGQDNAFDDDVYEQPVQDLAFNVDNVFQADDCDAFDSNVDEAPTALTMFMVNLSSADPVTNEVGPSYDSDILSEVQDHDHYQDVVCAHHEEHAMHDSVQLNHVVDSHADYTSNSNMILYDQYVNKNEVPVVHSDVSSVPNDAFMMIYNDMCEPHAQFISNPSRNIVVENSLTAELATYKEQVELPKPYYNELKKVAIGYKNPLCLTRAKKVQPALYNSHEIIKDNHVPAIVHNTEDTLEIAITRKKMNDKMKDPKCVTRKVKIAPHDYSKKNFLATFTPQKQLTPEQIFWSQDLIKLKFEALKEHTTVSRPIKALTVLTEGERGFKQTKECYLKEVIPFFKTLKDNFEGIQKALTKEVKEMKDVFEELEAEVAQNVVDRKHDAIERKNLLIANDNLIAECLFKEVFSMATNFELNEAQFT